MGKTYWYCPYCGEEVDPQNVTYQEMHEDCGHPVTLIDDSLPTYNQLQAENTRLREAITEFAKADKVLRRDYTEYCDKKVTHQTGFTRKTKLFTICGIRQ